MSGKGRRQPTATAAKSTPPTPVAPVTSSGIDEIVDEIFERTEKLKNELIDYRAKQAARTMSPGERAIKKAAEAAKKANKDADLATLINSEREAFERLTETKKEEYIAKHNPPKPKAAPRKGGKK